MRETVKEVTIDGVKYRVLLPTLQQSTDADVDYSKAYTKALQDGILPKAALERLLVKSGAWAQEDEDELNAAGAESQKVMMKIMSEKTRADKETYLPEFYAVRERLNNISSRKQLMLMNSAETKGEESKLGSMLAKCVQNEDGSQLWKNKTEMMSENNISLVQELGQVLMNFMGQLEEKIKQIDDLILGDSEPEKEESVRIVVEEVKPVAEEVKEEAQQVLL